MRPHNYATKLLEKPLTPERMQNRGRIESIWRNVNGYEHGVELSASESEWLFYEKLLETK